MLLFSSERLSKRIVGTMQGGDSDDDVSVPGSSCSWAVLVDELPRGYVCLRRGAAAQPGPALGLWQNLAPEGARFCLLMAHFFSFK